LGALLEMVTSLLLMIQELMLAAKLENGPVKDQTLELQVHFARTKILHAPHVLSMVKLFNMVQV
jgi:hypothetical protein